MRRIVALIGGGGGGGGGAGEGASLIEAAGAAPSPSSVLPPDTGGELLLHNATLPCILSAVVRAFRSHAAALPLMGHPLELVRNQLGRWVSGLDPPSAEAGALPVVSTKSELRVATPETPLPLVLAWLSEPDGPGAVPVVDKATGALVDVYSRSDILSLAHGGAYGALQSQWDSSTVSHALSLAHGSMHSRAASTGALSGSTDPSGMDKAALAARQTITVTRAEPLRRIVDRLALPGVRRVVVVSATNAVEGLVTDRDLSALLFA